MAGLLGYNPGIKQRMVGELLGTPLTQTPAFGFAGGMTGGVRGLQMTPQLLAKLRQLKSVSKPLSKTRAKQMGQQMALPPGMGGVQLRNIRNMFRSGEGIGEMRRLPR